MDGGNNNNNNCNDDNKDAKYNNQVRPLLVSSPFWKCVTSHISDEKSRHRARSKSLMVLRLCFDSLAFYRSSNTIIILSYNFLIHNNEMYTMELIFTRVGHKCRIAYCILYHFH